MVQDDSHSTFRDSAESISRRAESIAMALLPELGSPVNSSPGANPEYLKFSRHTGQYWDILPQISQSSGFFPNDGPRSHRPQDSQPAAIGRPHHHAGAGRQGRAIGL